MGTILIKIFLYIFQRNHNPFGGRMLRVKAGLCFGRVSVVTFASNIKFSQVLATLPIQFHRYYKAVHTIVSVQENQWAFARGINGFMGLQVPYFIRINFLYIIFLLTTLVFLEYYYLLIGQETNGVGTLPIFFYRQIIKNWGYLHCGSLRQPIQRDPTQFPPGYTRNVFVEFPSYIFSNKQFQMMYTLYQNLNTNQNWQQADINFTYQSSLNQTLLQSNHMQTSFFLLLPYPCMPYLTPFTPLTHPTPYAYSPYTYAELTHLQTCTPSSQIEANLFPEAPEEVKMEDACSKTKEEAPKRQPSRFRYPKKNVQSNVVNQCYSFLTTRSKSLPIVSKFLQSKQQINLFYMMMKQGRKKQTKYMGRNVLDELILLEDDHSVYLLYRKLGAKAIIKIIELRMAILGAINYFLKKIIVCALLTSSKLDRNTVREHLARSRDILAFLNRKTECL